MHAITNNYSSGNAEVNAFDSGIDLILMPEDIDYAIDSLTDAIYSEKISLERLNSSWEIWKHNIDCIRNRYKF